VEPSWLEPELSWLVEPSWLEPELSWLVEPSWLEPELSWLPEQRSMWSDPRSSPKTSRPAR